MQTTIPTTAAALRAASARSAAGQPEEYRAEVLAADTEVIDAAESATGGWKRLAGFADPIYVRNVNGVLLVIEDVRGYSETVKWHLAPLAVWVDTDIDNTDHIEGFDSLNDAKRYGVEVYGPHLA